MTIKTMPSFEYWSRIGRGKKATNIRPKPYLIGQYSYKPLHPPQKATKHCASALCMTLTFRPLKILNATLWLFLLYNLDTSDIADYDDLCTF